MSQYTRQQLIGIMIMRALERMALTLTELEAKASERVAIIYLESGHSACRAIEAGVNTGRALLVSRSASLTEW